MGSGGILVVSLRPCRSHETLGRTTRSHCPSWTTVTSHRHVINDLKTPRVGTLDTERYQFPRLNPLPWIYTRWYRKTTKDSRDFGDSRILSPNFYHRNSILPNINNRSSPLKLRSIDLESYLGVREWYRCPEWRRQSMEREGTGDNDVYRTGKMEK